MAINSHTIHGGLLFESMSFGEIEQLPLPDTVTISIPQNATVKVATGERVLTGQPLVHDNDNSAVSHASVSGTVTAVSTRSVTIDSDSRDEAYKTNRPDTDYQSLFQSMGLVGLGGAAFPVFKKLASAQNDKRTDILLINAAECDPAIYCDEALIQQRAADIVKGIQIAQQATDSKNCIIGIEENKTTAIKQLKKHLPADIQLTIVPAIYPSGAEQTLFKLCTGKNGSLQSNSALCFNIATCYAMYQAVELSQPLISRIVTVVFRDRIANFEMRIGTPLNHLEAATDLVTDNQIIEGGQMMGRPVSKDQFIGKHTNSLILQPEKSPKATPCIRCGACADVCPENLYPQQLYWHTQPHNTKALADLRLERCIECACCDAVCPSHIPLAKSFNKASLKIKVEKTEQNKATLAKQRYEKRLSRLNNQSIRQRKELDHKTANLASTSKTDDAKKALIAKALTRRRNKKSTDLGNNKEDPPR